MGNSLSEWTTFGIGGKARKISIARSFEILAELSSCALVLGNGSNVLVSDDGYDGNVVIDRYADISLSNGLAEVGSGTSLPRLCKFLAESGLSGLEWAAGIPGSVGGALVMNAGAFGGCIADRLVYADIVRGGRLVRLERSELGFGYRTSAIAKSDVVVRAAFELERGDTKAISARCAEYDGIRRRKQPRGKSAGSVFKNPQGVSVGAVLDRAGLKGVRRGGAAISEEHANIIVNTGGATARDVVWLIELMRAALLESGIEAQEEIIRIGEI